jgi:hypothetical protein
MSQTIGANFEKDRYPRGGFARGSERWLRIAVSDRQAVLNDPIQAAIGSRSAIEWLSPNPPDWAEYRDAGALQLLGLGNLVPALSEFWPRRGPQWDALGRSTAGDIFLVEAKANVPEFCSSASGAGPVSRAVISQRLNELAADLGASDNRVAWTGRFYQLANRLAHLNFLRNHGAPAWLVLVNFVGCTDARKPVAREAWEAVYEVAWYAMGLPRHHKLSKWIIEIHPHVSELAG